MKSIQEVQKVEIESFEKDSDWFYENIDNLRRKNLTNKYVAIKRENVIASGDKIEVVVTKIEKEGKDPSFVFIGFVHPKGYTLLL